MKSNLWRNLQPESKAVNEDRPEPAPDPTPGPDLRPRKTRHGRAPKDCRGDRNKRKINQAIRSLFNWGVK